MTLTASELTILGLLIERPQHGYDLEQVIEQRGIRQWTDIGFSSIYYLLAKLEKKGLVEVRERPAGSRARRIFHPTSAAYGAASENARALLAEVRTPPHPFLVGLANLPLIPEGEYEATLLARLRQIDARLAAITAAEEQQSPLPLAAREVFSYSLCLLEAERSWLASRVQVL
ncbi:DNA-binding PadR family transcriptional regulator [Microbacterium resistens]|uniref:DNA-binding PadR family transcriptional regulator n=1 Tax=Microbacterium resistens TaxID=156977 RepID=A0ABU1SFN2_9MICO|nr:PadR family transcriptional regulator [Microbacterium resistens]MDR6868369.1 DNA-binding PadR family transcriptional regulator [Microbacterium resistens]